MWPVPDPPLNHHRCVAQAFLPAVSQTSRSAGLVPVAKAAGLAEGWAGLKTRVTPVVTGGDINRGDFPQRREVHPNARPSEGGTSNGGTRSSKSPIIARIITSPALKAPVYRGSGQVSGGSNRAYPGNSDVSAERRPEPRVPRKLYPACPNRHWFALLVKWKRRPAAPYLPAPRVGRCRIADSPVDGAEPRPNAPRLTDVRAGLKTCATSHGCRNAGPVHGLDEHPDFGAFPTLSLQNST